MTTIKAVVFDWAGTMVDFGSRAPVAAMRAVFAEAGVEVPEAAVRRYMGVAKRDHVLAMLSEPEIGDGWKVVTGAVWTEADVDRLMLALEPAMRREAEAAADLIPGAAEAVADLMARGVRIGSTTGYTRSMMGGILPRAADQGYAPEVVVCAGETHEGRPAPLMIWKALVELGVWPAAAAVVVDDAPVGVVAGRTAGCWTVGLAATGNGMGLTQAALEALPAEERADRLAIVADDFEASGADVVIGGVADLSRALAMIETRRAEGRAPGAAPCLRLLS